MQKSIQFRLTLFKFYNCHYATPCHQTFLKVKITGMVIGIDIEGGLLSKSKSRGQT